MKERTQFITQCTIAPINVAAAAAIAIAIAADDRFDEAEADVYVHWTHRKMWTMLRPMAFDAKRKFRRKIYWRNGNNWTAQPTGNGHRKCQKKISSFKRYNSFHFRSWNKVIVCAMCEWSQSNHNVHYCYALEVEVMAMAARHGGWAQSQCQRKRWWWCCCGIRYINNTMPHDGLAPGAKRIAHMVYGIVRAA